jgi:hypothetical protein
VGLLPLLWWAALVLWSPGLGLTVLLGIVSLAIGLALRAARRRNATESDAALPPVARGASSRRRARVRRLTLGAGILVCLASPALVASAHGEQATAGARVELLAEVHLAQPTRFALIRDLEADQLALYKPDDPIFAGRDPLPVGRILAVDDRSLLLALPGGQTREILKGARLPSWRALLFAGSVVLDTLRFEVRSGGPVAPPGAEYAVTQIRGRQAILQRDALPGERQTAAASAAGPGLPPGPRGASARAGSSTPKEDALATLVKTVPIREVAPDTWEVAATDAKDLGASLGQVFTEALASATPHLTSWYGLAVTVETSLGSGTLDRSGFLVNTLTLAQDTGLAMGDRILFVNAQPVNTLGGLYGIYQTLQSDAGVSEVNLVVNRNNQLRTLTYRLR